MSGNRLLVEEEVIIFLVDRYPTVAKLKERLQKKKNCIAPKKWSNKNSNGHHFSSLVPFFSSSRGSASRAIDLGVCVWERGYNAGYIALVGEVSSKIFIIFMKLYVLIFLWCLVFFLTFYWTYKSFIIY